MRIRALPNTYLGGLGPDADALNRALRLGGERAISGKHGNMTIAVPALGNLHGMFEDTLGEDATRVLQRNYRLDLNGLIVHLATQRRPPQFGGPVVALWTMPKQTVALLSSRLSTDVILVPWTDDDVTHFLRVFVKSCG